MTSRMRAADADRERAAQELSEHVGAGRITTDEYDERVRGIYAATYLDEIDDAFDDLPGHGRSGQPFGGPFGGQFGRFGPFAQFGPRGQWSESLAGSSRFAAGRFVKGQVGRPFGGRRSPVGRAVGAVLGALIMLGVLMIVASIVVGTVAVLLHLIVPILVIALIVNLVGRRRGALRSGPRAHWR